MRSALSRAGDQPLEVWNRKFIMASLDARASRPAIARNFLGTLRTLFQWALSREHVNEDPTVSIKLESIKTDGFHTWSAAELATFEAHWPIGTRQRLAYDLMLWTGLRRGDAARVGPQHVFDGSIVIEPEKTKKHGTTVSIRILPPLARSIASTPIGDTFILNDYGKPFAKVSFGGWFKTACDAAGVPGRAHGLRKALAVKLAESGATDREIGAILGNNMAELYARKASVSRLSDTALARISPPPDPPSSP
jgi:integrase